MNINISSVIVLVSENGMDKVIINTDLPPTVYPWTDAASLILNVAKGQGEQYVIKNFAVKPEVINCK